MMNNPARFAALFTIASLLFALLLAAQAQETAPADDAPTAGETERAEPRGRLPNYYRLVVTPQQRRDIYEIQSRYNSQIEKLEAQIRELEKERDAEVESVLQPEQLAVVKKAREEAEARRQARREARAAAREAEAREAEGSE